VHHWPPHAIAPQTIFLAASAILPVPSTIAGFCPPGRACFTTLTKQAMPVIRYRTRDLTRLLPGTARRMRRIERIRGRSDDMLIIRGVNVFPSQIEAVLRRRSASRRAAPARPARRARCGGRDADQLRRPAAGHGVGRDRAAGRASDQSVCWGDDPGSCRRAGHHRALAGQGQAHPRPASENLSRRKASGPIMQNAIPPAAVDVLTDALPEDEVPGEMAGLAKCRRSFWTRVSAFLSHRTFHKQYQECDRKGQHGDHPKAVEIGKRRCLLLPQVFEFL
jgi:hypothetical protein